MLQLLAAILEENPMTPKDLGNETTAPARPQNLVATAVSSTRINLSWQDASNNEFGFIIERRGTSGEYTQITSLGANSDFFADTQLTPDTAYTYRIKAFNNAGESDYSNEHSATTLSEDEEGTPPDAPSNLRVLSSTENQILLEWNDNSDDESGFTIERHAGSGIFATRATLGTNAVSYLDQGLSAETTYHYRIKAFNEHGDSAYSNIVTETTQGEGIPGADYETYEEVVLTFTGPTVSEGGNPNPARDYRLWVTFVNSGTVIRRPGFWCADGNAAISGATSGNKWRVLFVPTKTGTWTWDAHFRQGTNIRTIPYTQNPTAGTATSFDGTSGSFTVTSSGNRGRLNYTGERYLKFDDGTYLLKQGADAPENRLGDPDFDNLHNNKPQYRVSWNQWHASDWTTNDPTWGNDGRGKGFIGHINYLDSEGMNAISMLLLSVLGDDGNISPYTTWNGTINTGTVDARTRFDVSKLDQWGIGFKHANDKGMFLHFKLQETEDDLLLDNGELGNERKLYYTEMVARFGHYLALNWNLGEEPKYRGKKNDPNQNLLKSFAAFISTIDDYHNHIVTHTNTDRKEEIYPHLIGTQSVLTGFSLQSNYLETHTDTLEWLERAEDAGVIWAAANDEQGPSDDGVRPDNPRDADTGATIANNHAAMRKNALWGHMMAGGWGNEWYFGYQYKAFWDGQIIGADDVECRNMRTRQGWWPYCLNALNFFNTHFPTFYQAENRNDLIGNNNDSNVKYCLADLTDDNEVIAIYLPTGGTTDVSLAGHTGTYTVKWYDPRNGGVLQDGTATSITGSGGSVGNPPSSTTSDWVVLLTRSGNTTLSIDRFRLLNANNGNVIDDDFTGGTISLSSPPKTIEVITSPSVVGSVGWTSNGQPEFTDNNAPYTIAGDTVGSGGFVESNNLVIWEVESEPNVDLWEFENSISGYTGSGYYVWRDSPVTKILTPGSGIITYTFVINSPGKYEFRWRSRIVIGDLSSEHNDTWIRFLSGSSVTDEGSGTPPTDGWIKVFISQRSRWSWQARTVDGTRNPVRRIFDAGVHQIQISARSVGHALDRIALYRYTHRSFDEPTFNNEPQSPQEGGGTTLNAWQKGAGTYNITATPYGGSNKSGIIGTPDAISVTVSDGTSSSVDPRTLGYLVVTDFGADPTGAANSTSAFIQALNQGGDTGKVVFVPFGTYRVTDTIYYYQYHDQFNTTSLPVGMVGEVVGGNYPKIVLDNSASGFNNPAAARAVIDCRLFWDNTNGGSSVTNDGPLPDDIFSDPSGTGWTDRRGSLYFCFFRDLEIDCGTGNSGAVGLNFSGAEDSFLANMKINARSGYACVHGTPGSGENTVNVECIGGDYGIIATSANSDAIIGCKFSGQSVAALMSTSFTPTVVVGFEATLNAGVSIMETSSFAPTAVGTFVFIDGKITATSGVVFNNPEGKNLHIHNVYITGSNDIIKSASEATITQAGTWKRIIDYVYVDQTKNQSGDPPFESGDNRLTSYSIINGAIQHTTTEPVVNVVTFSGTVPDTLRTRHYWAAGPYAGLPSYYGQGDGTYVIHPTGSSDYYQVIQNAINEASAAGHGRVFIVPGNEYPISQSLVLQHNTQLFSSNHFNTYISANNTFRNTAILTQSPQYFLHANGGVNATTYAGMLRFRLPGTGGNHTTPSTDDWFGPFRWEAGANSMTFHLPCTYLLSFYGVGNAPPPNPRALRYFTGHGGGRHYGSIGHGGTGQGFIDGAAGNTTNFHLIHIQGTTQPLWMYAQHTPFDSMHNAIKVNGASNVRLYNISAEERHTLAWIVDSINVALYGTGRGRSEPDIVKVLVEGASSNVVCAMLMTQIFSSGSSPYSDMLREVISGTRSVLWPECVTYLERGSLDDSVMIHNNMG